MPNSGAGIFYRRGRKKVPKKGHLFVEKALPTKANFGNHAAILKFDWLIDISVCPGQIGISEKFYSSRQKFKDTFQKTQNVALNAHILMSNRYYYAIMHNYVIVLIYSYNSCMTLFFYFLLNKLFARQNKVFATKGYHQPRNRLMRKAVTYSPKSNSKKIQAKLMELAQQSIQKQFKACFSGIWPKIMQVSPKTTFD